MALLTWNQKYSVGVKALDGQHIKLFEILNNLHAAMMKGQGRSITGPLLHELIGYAHSHFSEEEKIMAAAKYPALTDHKALHAGLVKQVQGFAVRYDLGEIALSHDLFIFLRDWLVTHIQKEDRQYGPWLNQHGVS
jgi:hemerythrin-like metal-binding protein